MANLFLAIPVPAADGPGAAVNILTFGWIKSFSLEGTLIGNVTLEISNDAITWAPLATLVVPGDICVGFASVFVRANVAGYVSGACVAAVGSDDLATLTAAIPVPPGNGTGAPVIVSALGQKKTVLYSGGPLYTDLSVIVEISEDGVTFSELAIFNGPTPASLSFECSIESMRTTVVGFVNGVVTVSVSAVNDPAGSGAFDTLQTAYDNSTGVPVDIQLDVVRGGIRILDVAGLTTPAFQVTSSASAQDSIMITRSFAGGGIGLDLSMAAATTGIGIRVTQAGTGDAINISSTGSGDGIDVTLSPTAVSLQRGIRIAMTGGVNNIGSAIEITSNGVAPGSGIFVSMTGAQHAIQATMTGGGVGLLVTHTAVGALTQCISLSASPAAASSIGGIGITLGVNNTGIPLNIGSSGTGIAAIQIASSGTTTGNSIRIVHTGTGSVIDVVHSAGAGASFLLSRSPAVVTAGTGFAITYGVNTTGVPISISQSGTGTAINLTQPGSGTAIAISKTGGGAGITLSDAAVVAGILLSITRGTASASALVALTNSTTGATGQLITLNKIPGAATGGDVVGSTVGLNSTGRFLTLSHLGSGEIWRITAAAGAFRSALMVDGQMRFVVGSAASPSVSSETTPTTGFFFPAGLISVSMGGTERFQFAATGTGEFIPPADNAGSVGTAARRFTLVRAVTITSGDIAFEDEVCPRCKQEFEAGDEIVLKVHRVANDETGKRISYSVPQHSLCEAPHA